MKQYLITVVIFKLILIINCNILDDVVSTIKKTKQDIRHKLTHGGEIVIEFTKNFTNLAPAPPSPPIPKYIGENYINSGLAKLNEKLDKLNVVYDHLSVAYDKLSVAFDKLTILLKKLWIEITQLDKTMKILAGYLVAPVKVPLRYVGKALDKFLTDMFDKLGDQIEKYVSEDTKKYYTVLQKKLEDIKKKGTTHNNNSLPTKMKKLGAELDKIHEEIENSQKHFIEMLGMKQHKNL